MDCLYYLTYSHIQFSVEFTFYVDKKVFSMTVTCVNFFSSSAIFVDNLWWSYKSDPFLKSGVGVLVEDRVKQWAPHIYSILEKTKSIPFAASSIWREPISHFDECSTKTGGY